jgi:hypothetical protein
MAFVHENLYRAGNFANIAMQSHVQYLCANLIQAYSAQGQNVELTTEVDDIELDLDRARLHRTDHQRAGVELAQACDQPAGMAGSS